MPASRATTTLMVLTWALFGAHVRGEPAAFMIRATVGERILEGQPLAWTDSQMRLLGRDGALYEFDPRDAKNAERLGPAFVEYSASEMAARLRTEFDARFDLSTSPHFVVVHPHGQGPVWADRLEALYRSFLHYMSVRGIRTSAATMPLTAVVYPDEAEYYRSAATRGTPLQPGTLGHYDPTSNRMFLYDAAGRGAEGDWSASAATAIHEATHQTAFNVGVHRRFAEQPRWVVEGLALMFEARGVWDASTVRPMRDRINAERLADFLHTLATRPDDWLAQLAASDARFTSDAPAAYAEAWMLTFYLCETRPQEYGEYLARVASRAAFSSYGPLERMRDFTAVFGRDLSLLSAQLERYASELR